MSKRGADVERKGNVRGPEVRVRSVHDAAVALFVMDFFPTSVGSLSDIPLRGFPYEQLEIIFKRLSFLCCLLSSFASPANVTNRSLDKYCGDPGECEFKMSFTRAPG